MRQPFVRAMPDKLATASQRLTIKCPVGGYPVEIIIWEKGRWHKKKLKLANRQQFILTYNFIYNFARSKLSFLVWGSSTSLLLSICASNLIFMSE
ncbi:Down syndrome cell adhesion molecule-like protein Dscam2 [Orchesella cincta]|uniref:Down syndrome cell adhesion molecule-like protein Dscam2 n=1 Tax=Orchesella cincta TaxID=48709 RepID=A0A1D2N9Y2_ORCCI|nr:Down syndrome cell adhesion molecule-like protein Dscam2 [Orchesella cincta]